MRRLEVGKGLTRVNVYLVTSDSSWVLVDTGTDDDSQAILRAAKSLFGADARPVSILLTHDHRDHSGSALELARIWKCGVYLHPKELPLAKIKSIRTIEEFAQALDPESAPPGLPDWKCVQVPGHSPGHVAFFRPRDGLLLAGDAVLTINLSSVLGLLLWLLHASKQKISISPDFMSWNWATAKKSAAALADLRPCVIASGHGDPVSGEELRRNMLDLASSLAGGGGVSGSRIMMSSAPRPPGDHNTTRLAPMAKDLTPQGYMRSVN